MSAIGALLAILVVLEVDGYEVVFHAPEVDTDAGTTSTSSQPDRPDLAPVYNPDPDAVIDAINRSKHPKDHDELTEVELNQSSLTKGGWRLPGFGSRRDDCGEHVPEAMRACQKNGCIHTFPRNCMQYDCPEHAPHACRRRAAGSKDAAGILPQLDAIARVCGSYYGESHGYYHLTISPEKDWVWQSDEPLRRAVGIGDHDGVIREIMDEIGIQGLVGAHPYRGDHEDHENNDLGEWGPRLPPFDEDDGGDRAWFGDVRDELTPSPHFHIIGVAAWVDLEDVVGKVEEETGWVIHNIEYEEGFRIENELLLARAVTYVLSHCLVYTTDDGQRRLGAWMKGPDVGKWTPYEKNKKRLKGKVYEAAQSTLGIVPPDLECDEQVPVDVTLPTFDHLPDLSRPSQDRNPIEAGIHDPLPHGDHPAGSGGPIARTAMGGSTDAVAGLGRNGVGDVDLDPPEGTTTAKTAPDSPVRADAGATPRDRDDDQEAADDADADDEALYEPCGGATVHISQMGRLVTDHEWRQRARRGTECMTAYREYQQHMADKGLDLEAPRRRDEIPEFYSADVAEWLGYDPPD